MAARGSKTSPNKIMLLPEDTIRNATFRMFTFRSRSMNMTYTSRYTNYININKAWQKSQQKRQN